MTERSNEYPGLCGQELCSFLQGKILFKSLQKRRGGGLTPKGGQAVAFRTRDISTGRAEIQGERFEIVHDNIGGFYLRPVFSTNPEKSRW